MSISESGEGQEFVAAQPVECKPADMISHLKGKIYIVKYRIDARIIEVETCEFVGTASALDLSAGWTVMSEKEGCVKAQRVLI